MAKKRKSTGLDVLTWKPPTREERIKSAADEFARTLIETDPKIQKAREDLAKQLTKMAQRPLIPQPQRKHR